jgi:hypothetical protein
MPKVTRRQRADGKLRQGARVESVLDGLPINGMQKRLPHSNVIKRRFGHIDIEALL